MTPLEEKSIQTQLKLAKEIEAHSHMLLYYVKDEARKVLDYKKLPIFSEDKSSVKLSAEDFKKIEDYLYNMKDEKWSNLGVWIGKEHEMRDVKKSLLNSLTV